MKIIDTLYLASIHMGFVFISINSINEINKGILHKNKVIVMANSSILIFSSIFLIKTTRMLL